MDRAPKIENVSRDVTTPLSGMVCRTSAGTSYGQPVYLKSEVSMFTHYENMKGNEQCKNWFEGIGVTQVIGNIIIW